jgi:hypothetical protein
MLLGFIIWYLFGVITYISLEKIGNKQVTVGELVLSFFVGLLGPIVLLVIVLMMFVGWAQESKLFDKKVF